MVDSMTLHSHSGGVGVRELHDRLSEYLQRVEEGQEVLVTKHGRPVARLSAVDPHRPLAELAERGLVRLPQGQRKPRQARVKASGQVSDLVAEQRR
jgi:prevent-host-death family protein